MLQSTLLSSGPARSGTRLIFQHEDDSGQVYGPFIEQRPKEEDHDAFIEKHALTLEEALNAPPAKEESLLDMVLAYDDATIKEQLSIDDDKLALLKSTSSK
jgi:hypothetical protein